MEGAHPKRGIVGMRGAHVLATLLTGLLLLSGIASAEEEEGTGEVLEWGDFIGIKVDTGDERTDVEYEVTVTDGANVSVYYVPERGWEEYNDEDSGTFKYVPLFSTLSTRSASKSFTETDGGVWYVIIEASDMEAVGVNSTIDYRVSWEEGSLAGLVYGAGFVLAILVVVIIVVLLARRGRGEEEPLPPPGPGRPPQRPAGGPEGPRQPPQF